MQNNFTEIIFNNKGFSLVLNVFILIICLIYLFFSFLVVRQVKLLTSGFETDSSEFLIILSYAHFLATIALTVIVLISLI